MFIQRMTSQIWINTTISEKIRKQGVGAGERAVVSEDKSFRRHRGVMAKRGKTIKKAGSSYSSESDSNRTSALSKITQRLHLGSDVSSDESAANSYDSGQDSNMSYQINKCVN